MECPCCAIVISLQQWYAQDDVLLILNLPAVVNMKFSTAFVILKKILRSRRINFILINARNNFIRNQLAVFFVVFAVLQMALF